MVLGLLLARAGVQVALLESHTDFDRDFRGDTVHPSTLELLDQIGLADRLHALPHAKLKTFRLVSPAGVHTLAELGRLPTRFPYIMIMPQSRFLEFLAEEMRQYSNLELVMGATAESLIEEAGVVRGVGYRSDGDRHEMRAALTVAADGRFSRLRKLADFDPVRRSPSMEVIWFRLPRRPEDSHEEGTLNVGAGGLVVLLGRTTQWQVGYAGPKGLFQRLKDEGLHALRQAVATIVPWLADRLAELAEWNDVSVLSVESTCLPRWHRPGLLFIGDAAHTMLPIGGVGINCAISDAVEAVNVLAEPLRAGRVDEKHLKEVERRRRGPTRLTQRLQREGQRRLVLRQADGADGFTVPLALRLFPHVPIIRDLPVRLIALGIPRVRLENLH